VCHLYLSFHVNISFKNKGLIKVNKWCIMLRLYFCVYFVTIQNHVDKNILEAKMEMKKRKQNEKKERKEKGRRKKKYKLK
jgi:hypothetical protein